MDVGAQCGENNAHVGCVGAQSRWGGHLCRGGEALARGGWLTGRRLVK